MERRRPAAPPEEPDTTGRPARTSSTRSAKVGSPQPLENNGTVGATSGVVGPIGRLRHRRALEGERLEVQIFAGR